MIAGPEYRGAPYVKGSDTSKQAANAVEPKRQPQREHVYLALRAAGPRGMTRPELAELLNLSENSVRPRVVELRNAARIYVAGQREGREVLVIDGVHHAANAEAAAQLDAAIAGAGLDAPLGPDTNSDGYPAGMTLEDLRYRGPA